MPTNEEIREMYSGYYSRNDGIGYVGYRSTPSISAIDFAIWDSIKRFGDTPSTSLDVGCAFGGRVAFLRRKGLRASGIDIMKEAVDFGRNRWNLDLRLGRFEDFEPDTTFDVITMIDFIEHLSSARSWSGRVKSLTRPNSLLLILTPDFDCYLEYGERWVGYNLSFEHVLFYNRQSLEYVLGKIGFTKAMAINFRPLPPIFVPSSDKRPSSLEILYTQLSRFPGVARLNDVRVRVSAAVIWRKLLEYGERQNSLLFVAKRTQ